MDINKEVLKKYITKIKFILRKMYKQRKKYSEFNNQCSNLIKFNEDMINDYRSDKSMLLDIEVLREIKYLELNNEKLRGSVDENKEKSKELLEEINKIGDSILELHTIIDNNFTLEEKIHLISGNTESCNNIIRYNKEHGEQEPGFLDLIVEHGEYQKNKQRKKDWVDCPNWEMPLFNAILKPMINRMKTSGVSILDCPVFEQMPYFTTDSNGNLMKNKTEVVREDGNVFIVRF